LCAASNE
jgi:hypothetical protein